MATRRKSLNESLQEEPEVTPEMEAFRMGRVSTETHKNQAEASSPIASGLPASSKPQQALKNFSMKLEEELYDSFSAVCFKRKQKMAKVVRNLIEQYVREDARSSQ